MRKYLFRGNTIRLMTLIVVQTLRTVGTVGVAMLINMLIDNVSTAISTNDTTLLIKGAIVCFLYALTLGVVIFLSERLKASNIRNILCNVRQDVMHNILTMNIHDFQSENNAEYITILNQNIGTFEENYLKNLLSIYESCISILGAVIFLLYINPLIAVISIVAMAIPSLIPKLFGKKLEVHQGNIMQETAGYNAKIKDVFNGFEVIKSYHAENRIKDLHQKSGSSLESSKVKMANIMAWLYGLANLSSITVQFLIMSLSGVFAVNGIISIGSIIAVTQLTGQVISPAFQLSTKLSHLKAVNPICKKLGDIVKLDTAHTDVNGIESMSHSLSISDVSFSYGNVPALDHVSLDFIAGGKYAIVGKSGSGKSTLLKLLGGYYNNYSGQVALNGKTGYRCDSAIMHQNVFLFDDTIRNNITMFERFPEDKIAEAISLSGLDEVIASLPDGLDTEVKENGSRFSGGEKQRIAVARAILHRKKLLLLDEATSSLDNETANRIESSLLSLPEVTFISVIHRLVPAILQKYDRIIVFDNGHIVEQGDFAELQAANGIFAELLSAGIA